MVSICNANLVINSPTQDTTQDQLYAIHSCKNVPEAPNNQSFGGGHRRGNKRNFI